MPDDHATLRAKIDRYRMLHDLNQDPQVRKALAELIEEAKEQLRALGGDPEKRS